MALQDRDCLQETIHYMKRLKLLTTPNPDVKEDMKMFELLGMKLQKPFTKKAQPQTVEASNSQFESLGEKPKWTRPEHTIERNELAKVKSQRLKV